VTAIRAALTLTAACTLGIGAVSCGGSTTGGPVQDAGGASGGTIPTTTTSTAKSDRTLTTAGGAPRVVQFAVPHRFWCLKAHPDQAQVTAGWSVPSATHVAVLLDGAQVHAGIRKSLPFSVQAGTPAGIGTTVVFPCRGTRTHRLTVRWQAHGSPWAEREATIRKGVGS
jgi:hypothetical protein